MSGGGPAGRVLVAGIGNLFLGDDGFGVEVVGRIDASALPEGVDVVDYGIRGVHLAYDLLDGRHDTLIMVDALPLDGPPGDLAVLDAADFDGGMGGDAEPGAPAVDGHGMHPLAVLRLLRRLGGEVRRVLVVGCRPAAVEERMGLSEPVRAAVDEAVRLVTTLAQAEAAQRAHPAATTHPRGAAHPATAAHLGSAIHLRGDHHPGPETLPDIETQPHTEACPRTEAHPHGEMHTDTDRADTERTCA